MTDEEPGWRARSRAVRADLDAARERGLAARHRAKLRARGDGGTYPCGRCGAEMALRQLLDHIDAHHREED